MNILETMDNFYLNSVIFKDLLINCDPLLTKFGIQAEKYYKEGDFNTCILKLRQFRELILQKVPEEQGIPRHDNEDLPDFIARTSYLFPNEINKILHQIRIKGNDAAHKFIEDPINARYLLEMSWQLGIWYINAKKRNVFETEDYQKPMLQIGENGISHVDEWIILVNLGQAYREIGETLEAIKFFEKALTVCQKEQARISQERCTYIYLEKAYLELSQLETAINYYEKILIIDRQFSNKRTIGVDLTNIGDLYIRLRKRKEAIQYYREALQIDIDEEDNGYAAIDSSRLGNAYSDLGEIEKAIENYQIALKMNQSIGDTEGERTYYTYLGDMYARMEKFQEAYNNYLMAKEIALKVGNPDYLSQVLKNLGNISINLHEYDQAIEWINQALSVDKETKNRRP